MYMEIIRPFETKDSNGEIGKGTGDGSEIADHLTPIVRPYHFKAQRISGTLWLGPVIKK